MDFINISDYGKNDGKEMVKVLRHVINDCKGRENVKLCIPKDTYHLYSDYAFETYAFISNNDKGLKRVVFLLEDMSDFILDCQGSHFICHGTIVPFIIRHSNNITIENFSLDWDMPFYLQAEVIDIDTKSGSFDISIHDECIYEIRNDKLVFMGKNPFDKDRWKQWPACLTTEITWEQNIHWNMWFEGDTKRPIYKEGQYKIKPQPRAKEISPGVVRLYDACDKLPRIGMVLVVKGKKEPNRISPAIFLSECSNVQVNNVTVHHAGGMGLIAQKCEDIYLKSFCVNLPKDSKRVCTTTADATHFNMCRGKILFEDCVFENMLDDGTNVHGSFVYAVEITNEHTVLCRYMHSQQVGIPFADKGDIIRLFTREDLQEYARFKVAAIYKYNSEFFEIEFEESVKDIIKLDTALDNYTWQPEIIMKGCIVRNNRARSILLQTGNKILIENNTFECSSASGIKFEGDAMFWWEAGKVENVNIKRNRFINIMGPCITIAPNVNIQKHPLARYHKGVKIYDNIFDIFNKCIVKAHAVDGFEFRNNIIRQNNSYDSNEEEPVLQFTGSEDIVIKDNQYLWDGQFSISCDSYSVEPVLK
jgi:hypothetical protein